ncbi:hypothetical protein FNV43_RR24289 [Rhamnella rubrinervis]|uniref:Ubiquinol-cytochrome c chaperone domain-containing protein n=1 Tax=Rhamnella rubrinervis TaxID=2594499 RepID=A0A8K0DL78_9ROSA|nr:hypothetical protein FNV43_RR24289 [Rhamnella rubrinervis]
MFWSKPCSLALPPDSPLRIEEPKCEGIKGIILTMLLFYSKQSKSIRGANVVFKRIISQVDKPTIYSVFNLEKTFKTTFSLLVLHMWLCLRRLKQEGKEGVEFGQYLYEIYNHDVELRVSKAGVNLLLTKWMKDLEKIFYGNIVAYDAAILPEAGKDALQNVIWRNVFSDEGSSKPNDAAASRAVQTMARYVRHEVSCLSLTDKDAIFSGNFMFTSLKSEEVKSVVLTVNHSCNGFAICAVVLDLIKETSVKIYSSKTVSWQLCTGSFLSHLTLYNVECNGGGFWNGGVRWISTWGAATAIYFNVDKERMSEMPLPPIPEEWED